MDSRLYPWLLKASLKGAKGFQDAQAPVLPKRLSAEDWGIRSKLAWEAEAKRPAQRRSLVRVALKLHARSLALWFICSAGLALCQTLGRAAATQRAVLSAQAIDGSDKLNTALLSTATVCGTILLEGIFWVLNEHFCECCFGAEFVNSMTHLLVQKAARTAGVADISETVLFGIDILGKVNSQIWYFCMMPYCPICFIAGSAGLIFQFGISGAIGVATLSMGMFLGNWTSVRAKASERRALQASEERLLLVRDILTSIKSVKALAWEGKFLRSLEVCRSCETKAYRRYHQLRAVGANLGRCLPVLGACATIVAAAFVEERPLRAQEIFPLLAVLQGMRDALCMSPTEFVYLRSFLLSLQRLQAYLEIPEVQPLDVTPIAGEHAQGSKIVACLSDATLCYPGPDQVAVLRDVSCNVSAGSLVGIVGPVASGKTALLRSLLGEMVSSSGRVQVFASRLGFCPQSPILISGSLLENVVMGRNLDVDHLNKLLGACALHEDIKTWPHGLDTWVGERGIAVSGGQAQRINLARALYVEPELLVLDDVFAKLDTATAEHIFREAISSHVGLGCAIVMAMSQPKFLAMCDSVYSIENGSAKQQKCTRSSFRHEYAGHVASQEAAQTVGVNPVAEVVHEAKTQDSSISTPASRETVQRYLAQAGNARLATVFLLVAAAYSCLGFNDVWITEWVAWAEDPQNERASSAELVYGIVMMAASLLFTILSTLGSVALFVVLSRSGQLFHSSTMSSLLRAKLSFWEKTANGRILSALSTDLAAIDGQFGMFAEMLLQFLVGTFTLLIVQAILAPLYLIMFPVAVGAGFYIFHATGSACAQMQKHTTAAETPLLTNFANLLDCRGMARPMGLTQFFIARHQAFLDSYHRSWYWSFAVRIVGAVASYALACILAAVLQAILWVQSSSPEAIGLAVSYSLVIAFFVYLCGGMAITLQSSITQMKRIFDLQCSQTVPSEAPWELEASNTRYQSLPPVSESVPCGSVVFEDVVMRYQLEPLPPTVGPLSFSIPASKRLGICGRTGAGKTSLFTVMLRFVEPSAGRILVDGTDLTSLRLQDVRKILALIPQEPFVFAGTIRHNLDPFGDFSEAAAQRALDRVGLSHFKLEAFVQENGDGLSVGERQLVSLARLLLQPAARCILLDEPSSSLDTASDDAIQALLASESRQRGCSCLCIAHRLGTILDYDLILILEGGRLLDIGPPQEMLAVTGSPLSKMLSGRETPSTANDNLCTI